MEEEFYAIIKLISGEELFSLVSVEHTEDNTILILQSPVTIKTFNHHGNTLMKIKPWVELSTDDIFVINYDKVMTITETSDEHLIEVYTRYLNDDDDDSSPLPNGSSRVNISKKMGYVTSVEEARDCLEKLYNSIEDTKES